MINSLNIRLDAKIPYLSCAQPFDHESFQPRGQIDRSLLEQESGHTNNLLLPKRRRGRWGYRTIDLSEVRVGRFEPFHGILTQRGFGTAFMRR